LRATKEKPVVKFRKRYPRFSEEKKRSEGKQDHIYEEEDKVYHRRFRPLKMITEGTENIALELVPRPRRRFRVRIPG